jgi:1-acyl-sn-glycerol-3-phosphate acyltransferase
MSHSTGSFSRAEDDPAVSILRSLNRCFARVYHRLEVDAPCQLPRQGGAIVVCNHLSALDPILVQATTSRLIRWMMAKEYYEQKALKWMLDLCGTIPVDRAGRDMAATRSALTALKDGYVLGVFPEGRIEPTRELLPFQPGIGLLALKSGAPVYPAYMDGTQRGSGMLSAYISAKVAYLTFGKPRRFKRAGKNGPSIEQATAAIQNDVEMLRVKILNRSIY